MASPELIRRITDSRRKEREEIEAKKLLQQGSPEEIVQEVAKAKAEQTEVKEIFHNMRTDCEDLLNSRGVIKRTHFLDEGLPYLWIKRKALETSIADEEGEEVKVVLFSSKIEPALSEIKLMFEKSVSGWGGDSFLLLGIDKSYICSGIENKRTPNLQDARDWKEVVDALKEQNRTDQSSPIEHK